MHSHLILFNLRRLNLFVQVNYLYQRFEHLASVMYDCDGEPKVRDPDVLYGQMHDNTNHANHAHNATPYNVQHLAQSLNAVHLHNEPGQNHLATGKPSPQSPLVNRAPTQRTHLDNVWPSTEVPQDPSRPARSSRRLPNNSVSEGRHDRCYCENPPRTFESRSDGRRLSNRNGTRPRSAAV